MRINILNILKKLYQLNKDVVSPQIIANKDFAKYFTAHINSDDNTKINNNIIKEIDINKNLNNLINIYDNNYINNTKNTKIYKNGDKYIGEFKNNLRDGKGILYYNKKNSHNKDKYEGF